MAGEAAVGEAQASGATESLLGAADAGGGSPPQEAQSREGHITSGGDRREEGAQPQQPQHSPQLAYTRFRERLKHHSAKGLSEKLLKFVSSFPSGLSRQDAADRIHSFLTRAQDEMFSEVVAFAEDVDEEGRAEAAEALEKFLLSRLYQKIFATDPADQAEDSKLRERFASLSWVSFDHLGIPPMDPSLLTLALNELRRVDSYKAPRDKLVIILNATRVINDVLKRTLEDSGAIGRPLSADDFLPLLIYSVLKAAPDRLHSNVEFVAAFRHPSRLNGEDAYFLTALQSATAFVRDASPKVLEVSEEEFRSRCEECLAAARQAERLAASPAAATTASAEASAETGPATVAAKAVEMSAEERQALLEQVSALPFSYEAVPSARQLRLDQIPGLLDEYREMAKLLRRVQEGTIVCPSGD